MKLFQANAHKSIVIYIYIYIYYKRGEASNLFHAANTPPELNPVLVAGLQAFP
jgi:hypothetical protein